MPGVIDQSKVERDIDDIRKTVNEDVIVSPRSGLDYESLPMLVRRLSENGMFKPFSSEAELLTYVPEIMPTAAKALDTKKVWIYEQTSVVGIEPKTFAWHDTGFSEEELAKIYTKQNIQLISDSASSIVATSVNPTFGYENTGAVGAAADSTYIFPSATLSATVLKRLKFTSGKADAELKVKVFKKIGTSFVFDRDLITLKTKIGTNSIDLDPVLPLNASEYIAVSILTQDALKYMNTTQSYNLYYVGGAYATTIADTAYGRTAFIQFSAYTKTEIDKIPDAINLLDAKSAKSLKMGCQVIEGSSVNANAAHWIPDQICTVSGTIRKFSTYAAVAGKLQIGVYSKSAAIFTRKRFVEVDVIVGLNALDVNIDIDVGEYAGIRTQAAGLTTYLSNNKNAFNIFSANPATNEQSFSGPTSGFAWQFSFDVIERKVAKKLWQDKKVVTFGDSITWYDGRQFGAGHLESGQMVIGYQSYMRDKLGCNADNQGRSGWDMTQILSVVNSYDFTNVHAVTLTSGANDHRKNVPIGVVGAIGSAFNVTTFAGAMQTAIEKIINANKDIKLFLITPIRGWYFESGTSNVPGPYKNEQLLSIDYVNMIKSLGQLYSLPVIDWYNEVGFNELNKSYFLGDNPETVPFYLLHPNQKGYKKMGDMVVGSLSKY